MTAKEVITGIRMFLDESRDYFWDIELIEEAVNRAQLFVLQQAVRTQDDRCYRPLVKRSAMCKSGETITDLNLIPANIFHILGGRIYPAVFSTGRAVGIKATYLPRHTYNSMFPMQPSSPLGINTLRFGDGFPRTAYFTIETSGYNEDTTQRFWTPRFQHRVYFNADDPDNDAIEILYVETPPRFRARIQKLLPGQSQDPSNVTDLAIAPEYHLKVITIAAEYLIDLDVGEIHRGEIYFDNQTIPVNMLGNIDGFIQQQNQQAASR